MANFYALLIGIDYYQPNPYYKSLQGAIRDIDKVASYLEKSLHIPAERITRLTSPLPDTNSLADVRSARQESPPTYQNIVGAFEQITTEAQPQDIVYIHYSGHGGRAKTIFAEIKGDGQFDEGLVPMDVGEAGRYLRDVEMATLLKRMTDKGLVVTVIFDSCHAGGATRGDVEIRGARNGAADIQERPLKSAVASRAELVQNWLTLTQNDHQQGWLPGHRDYVFLGACHPSEFAYEATFDGSDRYGALTYWMVDTLMNGRSAMTYQSLYNRVKGMIQSQFPYQLPMLLGEGDRLVFGDDRQCQPYTMVIIGVTADQTKVTLDAGMAAGLSAGARLAIYPSSDVADKTQQLAIAELTDEIQADRSIARILSPEQGGIAIGGKIEAGGAAVMVTAPVNLVGKVRLYTEKQVGDLEQDLPGALVDRQTAALASIREALVGNGWVQEVSAGSPAHYQVAIGRDGAYEICMGMPIPRLRPPLNIDDPAAPKQVVDRLVHLVKYQAVLNLDNPASDLTDYLEFGLCDRDKKPFADPQNVCLKAGEVSFLRIKNTSAQALNVAVLDIEPTWEISQVPIQGQPSSFFPLAPGQESFTKLRLQLPPDYQKVQETLKIFATKGLANFQWLTLPALDVPLAAKGVALDEPLHRRGVGAAVNPLNKLLATIGGDVDKAPTVTRAMVYESDPGADWITQDISITVEI